MLCFKSSPLLELPYPFFFLHIQWSPKLIPIQVYAIIQTPHTAVLDIRWSLTWQLPSKNDLWLPIAKESKQCREQSSTVFHPAPAHSISTPKADCVLLYATGQLYRQTVQAFWIKMLHAAVHLPNIIMCQLPKDNNQQFSGVRHLHTG